MISYTLGETLNEEGENVPWQEGTVQSTLDALSSFGYKISEENMDKARKLMNAFFLRDQKAYEEVLEKQTKEVGHRRGHGWNTIKMLKMLNLSEDSTFPEILAELDGLLEPFNANEE